ncbi:golgin subfamily A member 4-like, partial [Asbolus verrucosus]
VDAMGQQESKRKLQQMTTSVIKMRKDIRNGTVIRNDMVEKCQEILQRYSREIKVHSSKRVKGPEVNNLERLIENTEAELNALVVQEADLDLAAIPTNSFSRGSSRNNTKEKNKPVKEITDTVEEIRQQIRSGQIQREDYDRLQKALVGYSQQLSYLLKKHKKSEVDAAQKLVSSVTHELLTNQEHENVDNVSTPPPPEKPEIPEKPSLPEITSNSSTGSLDDIENKLQTLKNDIKVAQANKDKSRLHFLGKSVQTLMTDLHMVNVENHILNEERKELLEKNLIRAHHQVDRIKKELNAESESSHLAELQKKEKKKKCLQDLEDIENMVMVISRNLNFQNFKSEKETFNNYKNKLNSIEDVCQEVSLKKSEVFDVVLNVENAFTRLEMEERLNDAEWKHYQYKVDLNKFTETTESEEYKKYRQFLLQLRDCVTPILEVSQKVDDKKKYVLYNIENNIAALDKKAKDNEAKSKQQNEGVILKKNLTINNQNLVDNLIGSFKEFEQYFSGNCNLTELKNILFQLSDLRKSIDERVRVLEYQIINEDPDIQLVTIKADYVDTPVSSGVPAGVQMDNIQRDVETMQADIENSKYSKDSQLYKDMKDKLESYKTEVKNLSRSSEDCGKTGDSILKYIDNVLMLLDNNLSNRKSTTEDLLIDIMSIGTRINDLGSKIHGYNYTSEDYDSIKNSLLEHQFYLKNLKIASTRNNLCKSRDEILLQIKRYLSELDNLRKNDHSKATSAEEKQFRQELRKLKDKVSRYSGTYKNVLYKSIEGDLNKCLNKVDKVFNDNNVASKVKRDIENHILILEQKSNKDQKYDSVKRDVRDPGTKELTEIRENVESVKRELTKPRRLAKEELDKLDAKLTLSILALDNIKNDNLNDEKNKLYQDIHLYFGRIQELMVVKPVITEDVVENQFNKQQAAAETIAQVERKLEEIKPAILTFVGLETSLQFFELDEALIGSTLKLDGLKLDKTDELQQMKIRLLKEIHKYSDILDARVNQTEEIGNLEKEVKEMLMKIDSFNGYFGDPEYSSLDEQIIRLKVNLGKLDANQELLARKEACVREVDDCMKKLNETAKTASDGLAGTLV